MAKNSIRDYSATNSSNTDIQSIDISEGCSPAGINNAIREVMADLKDVSTGAVALESPSADSLTVTGDLTVDTNTLYVDSTNNGVGVGNTTPSSFFSGATQLVIGSGSGNQGITIYSGATGVGNIKFADGTATDAEKTAGGIRYDHSNGFMRFDTNDGSERLRIDSSGNLLVAGTSAISFGIPSLQVGGSNGNALITIQRNTTGSASQLRFYNPNGNVGEVYTSGSSTVYATSSDYRLKENVTADWDATTRLKQLNPVRFNFIADPDTTVDGFLAHEVQDIVPEAISGTKDAVDDEGNPVYQGIDQSKLVPLLVKTIQELEARITALEAN